MQPKVSLKWDFKVEFAVLDVNVPEFSGPCLQDVSPLIRPLQVNHVIKSNDITF